MNDLMAELHAKHWSMESNALNAFLASMRVATDAYSAIQLEKRPEDIQRAVVTVDGSTAIMDLNGPMMASVPWWFSWFGVGAFDMTLGAEAITSLDADPDIDKIIVRADTPGGEAGIALENFSTAIRNSQTPVVFEVGDMLASAGLYAGANASQINAQPLSRIGSIGTYIVMIDSSKAAENEGVKVHLITNKGATVKGAGVQGTEVTDEMIAEMQAWIDPLNDAFVQNVSNGRGMTESQVRAINTGQMFFAQEAKELGLIDTISTPAEIGGHSSPDNQANQRESEMDIALAKLAGAYPAHSDVIISMAEDGKGVDKIEARVLGLEVEAQHKQAVDRADTADAALASMTEERDAEKARADTAEAKSAELQTELDESGKIDGVTDPGSALDGGSVATASAEEIESMEPAKKAAYYRDLANATDKE